MSTPWIDLTGFKLRSAMPPENVDQLEIQYPGFLATKLADNQAFIEARLTKRYALPFVAPVPLAAIRWLVALVTLDAYLRRGFNPSGAENSLYKDASDAALAEIKEAADSETGLFELPLRQDLPSSSAVSKGGPRSYSEASPYAWTDSQACIGRREDSRGR